MGEEQALQEEGCNMRALGVEDMWKDSIAQDKEMQLLEGDTDRSSKWE